MAKFDHSTGRRIYEKVDNILGTGQTTMVCSKMSLDNLETCTGVTIKAYEIHVPGDFDETKSDCIFIGGIIKHTPEYDSQHAFDWIFDD